MIIRLAVRPLGGMACSEADLNHLASEGHMVFSTAQAREALGSGSQDTNKLL
jgi:hypothetical protein